MKKIIVGVLGIAIFGSFGLFASENTGNAGNQAVPGKTREAFTAGSRNIVRRASQELDKRNGGSLSCSAEAKNPSVSSSTEALKKATVDMDYGCFPHSNRGLHTYTEKPTFRDYFYNGCNDCP